MNGPARPAVIDLNSSPLRRLGVCGLWSLRRSFGAERVAMALGEAALPGWTMVRSPIWHGVSSLGRFAYVGPDRAVLVESVLDEENSSAVARLDDAAGELAAVLGRSSATVGAVACVSGDVEPRDLPGPSGRLVTVTGTTWLCGLLRSRYVVDGPERAVGPPAIASDGPRRAAQRALYVELVDKLPGWWTVPELVLDDGGGEPFDLVAVGCTGVLVVDVSQDLTDIRVARLARWTRRLRTVLPVSDVIPVAISSGPDVYGPQTDDAGYQIAWIDPDRLAAFAAGLSCRGVDVQQLALLNQPTPFWSRRVRRDASGVTVQIGSPA
ncbi:hypothetical protein CS0771_48040 [Catellatospora sp. IY07-71]|uniref:hypothetical protein n=1 Tax=Catellatospora sp. IY07-71 TaxID=2728827 RepID=UPI001BB3968A|nr:hypothetical protein [Catellatospora sp. IY07-71]BCJ75260.1 hypothetical protein CS0771_48040 [Catellatospora sp. IY07-71]